MPNHLGPTKENTPSRYNDTIRKLLPIAGTIATSFVPVSTPEHAVLYGLAGMTLNALAEKLWTIKSAPRTTDLSAETYQGLYIVPERGTSGSIYWLVQPRHEKEINEQHVSQGLIRDAMIPNSVEVLGSFASRILAEDKGRELNGQLCIFLDEDSQESHPAWKIIAQSTLSTVGKRAKRLAPASTTPLGSWRISDLSYGSSQTSSKKLYVAYRQLRDVSGQVRFEIFPDPPASPYRDTLVLKQDLNAKNAFSKFDTNVLDPPREECSILPSWREQAIAAKGLDYYAREIEVEDCDPAMPSAESWAVERSPNSTQWRAVQTETRCERTVRRLLVRPEDPMTIWEEPSPKAFTEFFAHQGIDIDPPSQRSDLDAPRVNRPQASLSQPRMRK